MQIIIDIDENVFTRLFDNVTEDYEIVNDDLFKIAKSIRKGTPLPKGHGRLIDADKAVREENSKLVDFETTNTRDRSYCRYARMILNDAPTIIEADKEESEDKE